MFFEEQRSLHASTKKHSLGFLRRNKKTKEKSPDATGTITIQRDLLETIVRQLQSSDEDEVVCCLAAWENTDGNGEPYVTVQLSAKFVSRKSQTPAKSNLVEFLDEQEIVQ